MRPSTLARSRSASSSAQRRRLNAVCAFCWGSSIVNVGTLLSYPCCFGWVKGSPAERRCLVKGTVASAGKMKGLRGAKLANPYLRWAFGEAAVIAKRDPRVFRTLAQSLEARMNGNKCKANSVIAIKLARAFYFMLKTKGSLTPTASSRPCAKPPQRFGQRTFSNYSLPLGSGSSSLPSITRR